MNISALRPDSVNRVVVTAGSQNQDLALQRPSWTSDISCPGELVGMGSGRRGKLSPDGLTLGLQDPSAESLGAAKGMSLSRRRKRGCFGISQPWLMGVTQTKGQTPAGINQPGSTTLQLCLFTLTGGVAHCISGVRF